MCVVLGGGEATGALALRHGADRMHRSARARVPHGVELRESVRAGARVFAADVVSLVGTLCT